MQENSVMRLVYTFFLGVLIAVFVGVGINTFYEGPKAPEPNGIFTTPVKDDAELQKQQRDYDAKYIVYNESLRSYSRNVSVVVMMAAVILVGLSLYYEKRSSIIANGVMLGGLFTLVYGVIRSMVSEDTRYIFMAATVALVVALFLGYRRFGGHVEQAPRTKASRTKKKRQ